MVGMFAVTGCSQPAENEAEVTPDAETTAPATGETIRIASEGHTLRSTIQKPMVHSLASISMWSMPYVKKCRQTVKSLPRIGKASFPA